MEQGINQWFFASMEEEGILSEEAVFLLVVRMLKSMQMYYEANTDEFPDDHEFDAWRFMCCELAELSADPDMQQLLKVAKEDVQESVDATQAVINKMKGGAA